MKKILYILLLWAGAMSVARAGVVYQCNFETAAERQQWVRTVYRADISGDRAAAENCESKWYIGAPGQFEFRSTGRNGLYISSDADSARAVYTANSATGYRVLCYRDMTLAEGHYSMIFSWRADGYESSSRLYVYWVPQTTLIWSDPASSQVIPMWGRNGGMNLVTTADGCLYGEKAWQGQRLELDINESNTQGRLLFIWSCNHDTPVPPSACIDDIVLYSDAPVCESLPASFSARRDEGCFWRAKTGTTYQLIAVNSITGETIDTLMTASALSCQWKPQVPETGYYYFYIRVINPQNGEYTEWKRTGTLMHVPQDGCIDYLDLKNAKCYTGKAGAGQYSAWMYLMANPVEAAGDEPYKSIQSRHTVHYDPIEIDPRTKMVQNGLNIGLPTVPPGEFASVRLGNWDRNSEAEGIMYELDVEKNATEILVLKYAPVLQYASQHSAGGGEYEQHGSNEQSHFYVTFLNQDGEIQRAGCYTFDFSPPGGSTAGDPHWHKTPSVNGDGRDDGDVQWREWDSVYISLMDYVGEHIYLQLATYDCTASGHFGYAYFNIACQSGQLTGLACEDFENDRFVAPDGFLYRWYRQDNPSQILSTEREFHIPGNDTLLYFVDVYSAGREACGYTLTANPNPLAPRALVSRLGQSITDCKTTVSLANSSGIYRINRQTRLPMYQDEDEKLSDVVWDWGDGTIESNMSARVQHIYDRSGEYDVHVSAYYGGQEGCYNDTVLHYSIALGHDLDTVVYRCAGEKYFDKQMRKIFETDTVVIDSSYIDPDGCKATYRLDLRYVEEVRDTAVICRGEVYNLLGHEFTESGVFQFKTDTEEGCQLPVTLVLRVRDTIVAEIPDTVWVCNDDPDFPIPFRFSAGTCVGMLVHPDAKAIAAGFEPEYAQMATTGGGFLLDYDYGEYIQMPRPGGKYILPDYYPMTLTFLSDSCQDYVKRVVVAVSYMTQGFLHVKRNYISLYNEQFNYGGFTYTEDYAWYRNGMLMPGENRSYIQVTDDDIYSSFAAEVVRVSDGVRMRSCPVTYFGNNASDPNIGKMPAARLMPDGRTLGVTDAQSVSVFDALGHCVMRVNMPNDTPENYITMPNMKGLYIVVLDYAYSTKVILY